MCGIVGKISFNGRVNRTDIQKMADKIIHRGPDDEGFYINKNIGLGSRRLSILDLSPNGHMPMISESGDEVITYNGEVYNYKDYWDELKQEGHNFKSTSDTEVVLYLYKKYGIECLEKLRGMFAFVIYDKKKNIVFGARDRFGQKPLKYYLDENVFVFGSELKSILTNAEVPKEVDYKALSDYLTYQYAPSPSTGFKNIKKLPNAHYFILDLAKKEIKIERYWDADFSRKKNISIHDWKDLIVEKFEESVKLRMISDVPLGVFLSGGVDSSTVLAMMAKNSSKPVKTFSIGFENKDFDERKYASTVAKLFGADHHDMVVKPDMINDLPKIIYAYEEPFADSSMVPTYYLSRFTSEHVTVALNGDGGDENFAGYSRYAYFKKFLHLNKIPKSLCMLGENLLNFMNEPFSNINFLKRSRNILKLLKEDDLINLYLNYNSTFKKSEKLQMYKEDSPIRQFVESSNFFRSIFNEANSSKVLEKILYTDVNSYLPNDLLVKVDIATMSQSLEGRSPFLDHHFFELTSLIPYNLKLNGQETKYVLKKSLEHILPADILYRKKMGFGIPVADWFRGELKDFFTETVIENSIFIKSIIKKDFLLNLLEQHQTNNDTDGAQLWTLLSLELWYRSFFK